jgi:hypothetical protein
MTTTLKHKGTVMKKWLLVISLFLCGYVVLVAGCNKAEETKPEATTPVRRPPQRPDN